MLRFFSIIFFLIGSTAAAQSFDKSAYREPGASYLGYKSRAVIFGGHGDNTGDSAVAVAETGALGALPKATEWESVAVMTERFSRLRDHRFMSTVNKPGFLRRSSWLYPDDGCFARAALAVRNLVQWNFTAPNKVFAFGNLRVKTANAPGGEVTWWYHVAPLVEVNGEKYVLDPAIEPGGPLKLGEWLARMSERPEDIEVSVCGSGAYTPNDSCAKTTDGVESYAETDQVWFLEQEWQRLLDLQRDPEQELGDNPPWLH